MRRTTTRVKTQITENMTNRCSRRSSRARSACSSDVPIDIASSRVSSTGEVAPVILRVLSLAASQEVFEVRFAAASKLTADDAVSGRGGDRRRYHWVPGGVFLSGGWPPGRPYRPRRGSIRYRGSQRRGGVFF